MQPTSRQHVIGNKALASPPLTMVLIACIVMAGFCMPNEVRSAETPQDSSDRVSRQSENVAPWLRRWARENQRNNPAVLSAFRGVVENAGRSTLLVYSDGRQVAYGTVVDSAGFVLTKASELSGQAECQIAGGRKIAAKVIGIHSELDLAMLKIDTADAVPVQWQTDARIRPGNWLATAGVDPTPLAIGVISVPARRIARARAILGIQLDEATAAARVTHVYADSGAEAAGIKNGDLVIALNKNPIDSAQELINHLRKFRPGDRVVLTIQRNEQEMRAVATLQNSANTPLGQREHTTKSLGRKLSKRHSGFPRAFQHDSTLRPNECGSPVVDLTGKTIGINIAVSDRVSTLAIPVTSILPVLEELKSGKYAPTDIGSDVSVIRRREAISRWSRRLRTFQANHRNTLSALNSARQLILQKPANAAAQAALQKLEAQAARTKRSVEEAQQRLEQLEQRAGVELSAAP
ncbi:MAG: PDZ domain-containing protein [Planctomycetota bacterium]|nr:PDZ domain-containing protein [Planctomycetota bacterium]